MSHDPDILPAAPGDTPAIKTLLRSSHLHCEDLTQEHLHDFLVARDAEEIIGVVGLEAYEENGLLRSLAVKTSHRGHGMGRELVRHLEHHAGNRGVDRLYLLTTTADHFFAHLGYIRIDRETVPPPIQQTTEFTDICPSDAVCMTKAL